NVGLPDGDYTLAGLSLTQTWTAVQTFGTNAALNASTITAGTLPVARGGTGVTTSTGSTNVVLSNSPTIVTPTIASFTNATHTHADAAGGGTLNASAIAAGTVATARLGSGTANSGAYLAGDQTWKQLDTARTWA